jgi:hypothetical protein
MPGWVEDVCGSAGSAVLGTAAAKQGWWPGFCCSGVRSPEDEPVWGAPLRWGMKQLLKAQLCSGGVVEGVSFLAAG